MYYNRLDVYANIQVYTMALTNETVPTTLSHTTIEMMDDKKEVGNKFHHVRATVYTIYTTFDLIVHIRLWDDMFTCKIQIKI